MQYISLNTFYLRDFTLKRQGSDEGGIQYFLWNATVIKNLDIDKIYFNKLSTIKRQCEIRNNLRYIA